MSPQVRIDRAPLVLVQQRDDALLRPLVALLVLEGFRAHGVRELEHVVDAVCTKHPAIVVLDGRHPAVGALSAVLTAAHTNCHVLVLGTPDAPEPNPTGPGVERITWPLDTDELLAWLRFVTEPRGPSSQTIH